METESDILKMKQRRADKYRQERKERGMEEELTAMEHGMGFRFGNNHPCEFIINGKRVNWLDYRKGQ